MNEEYNKVNNVASTLWFYIKEIGLFIGEQLNENRKETIQSCVSIIFITFYLFYSSRLILSIFIFCIFIYVVLVHLEHKWIKRSENKDSEEISYFLLTFFAWFILSSLWTGPSHYNHCTWREYHFGSWIYLIMGAQSLFIFLPEPEEKNIYLIFSFTWILNFIYPSIYIVTGCTQFLMLYVKVFIMIFVWNFLGFTHYMKIRMMGLLCIMGFWMVFVTALFICVRAFYFNFDISYQSLPQPNAEKKSKRKSSKKKVDP